MDTMWCYPQRTQASGLPVSDRDCDPATENTKSGADTLSPPWLSYLQPGHRALHRRACLVPSPKCGLPERGALPALGHC